ncbi:hypothetical protein C8R41DRAFT_784063, partial [Lentinula lateritia]
MEFEELQEGKEAAFIVELNAAELSADSSEFRGSFSIPLISASLGDSPSIDKLNLAFLHAYAYLTYDTPTFDSFSLCSAIPAGEPPHLPATTHLSKSQTLLQHDLLTCSLSSCNSATSNKNLCKFPTFAATKKRYKPVERRTQPVPATLPEKFRVVRHFPSDPLEHLPTLNPDPPPFVPTGRYTQERKEFIDSVHDPEFLWPQE